MLLGHERLGQLAVGRGWGPSLVSLACTREDMWLDQCLLTVAHAKRVYVPKMLAEDHCLLAFSGSVDPLRHSCK